MNSHRDRVENAIEGELREHVGSLMDDEVDEIKYIIASAVQRALVITKSDYRQTEGKGRWILRPYKQAGISNESHRNLIKFMLMDKHRTEYENMGLDEDCLNAESAQLTDDIFEMLGITDDEQDMVGGYWMLHAGVKPTPKAEDLVPDFNGNFNTLVNTSYQHKTTDDYVPDHNATFGAAPAERAKQLEAGAKYTAGEFKGFCKSQENGEGFWCLRLETPICTYAQVYDGHITEEEARSNFVTCYYPMYLDDYERANAVEDWADTEQSGRKADFAKD
jgi:hypothetical protein